jgi:hypothetical protein
MLTGSIQQDKIAILNINTPNIKVPKSIKPILIDLKGEVNSNIMIVGKLISYFEQ